VAPKAHHQQNCSVFHIRNHHAGYQLKVESSPGKLLPFQNNPTYLGITLDRSLTFKDHILKLKNKVSSQVYLIKCLAGLTWGCSFNVFRTSASVLVYAPAEYCSQAWRQSAHTRKLDTQLKEAMRTVSGCVRSTPTDFLPFLSGSLPPTTQRNTACLELHRKSQSPDHLLHETLYIRRTANRLCSRRPLRPLMENLTNQDYFPPPVLDSLKPYISCFTNSPPGCYMPSKARVQLKRLYMGHGRFNDNLYKMGLADNKNCVCGDIQSASLYHCTVVAPPCSITNTTNEDLIEYLCNSF